VTPARDALLDKAMAHVAAHGMSDLSLRELAAAIGTSHRMVLYHFGSREGLVAAIVASMEQTQRDALAALADSAASPREVIERQWAQLTDPAVLPFVALFFEVLAMAVHERPGTEGFLESMTEPWLDEAMAAGRLLGIEPDRDELRLGVAVSRGLLAEVLASGEVAGPTRSLQRFLDLWEAGSAS
jgi:AcrR family transcriptional regulator